MKRQRTLPQVGGVDPPSVALSFRGHLQCIHPPFRPHPHAAASGTPGPVSVRPGDKVQEGMLIGKAEGARSANVHSSIPGAVVRVIETKGG